jgi:hypothetical protein
MFLAVRSVPHRGILFFWGIIPGLFHPVPGPSDKPETIENDEDDTNDNGGKSE